MIRKAFSYIANLTVGILVIGFLGYNAIAFLINNGYFKPDIKCDDKEVQELVFDIYNNNIKNASNPMLSNMTKMLPDIDRIEDIRTQSIDKELDKKTCKANLFFKNNTQTQLVYEVQYQNEKIYVELDSDSLQALFMQNMFNIMNKKDK